MDGPSTSSVSATTAMFSGPITTGASVSVAEASVRLPHAATVMAATARRLTSPYTALRVFMGTPISGFCRPPWAGVGVLLIDGWRWAP